MADSFEKTAPPAKSRWFSPILLLPVNVLFVIPAVALWLTEYHWAANHPLLVTVGCFLLLCGLGLAVWTMRLFHSIGHGTAAPWDPPRNLVVAGPYRYVRNPMLTSVFCMQAAEALLLNSWVLFIFLLVFVVANMLYFPLVEEKKLEKRFGDAYQQYRRNVPRWIPRLRPWRGV